MALFSSHTVTPPSLINASICFPAEMTMPRYRSANGCRIGATQSRAPVTPRFGDTGGVPELGLTEVPDGVPEPRS